MELAALCLALGRGVRTGPTDAITMCEGQNATVRQHYKKASVPTVTSRHLKKVITVMLNLSNNKKNILKEISVYCLHIVLEQRKVLEVLELSKQLKLRSDAA